LFDIVALSTTNKDICMQCDSWTDYCCGYNSPTCPQQFELPLKSFFVYAYTPVIYDPENNELNLGFGFGNSTNGFGIKADQAISLKYDQRYYVVFDKVETLYTLHTYLTPDHRHRSFWLPHSGELTIFNVYGNVIFQTKDYKNNWNGKDLEATFYDIGLKCEEIISKKTGKPVLDIESCKPRDESTQLKIVDTYKISKR